MKLFQTVLITLVIASAGISTQAQTTTAAKSTTKVAVVQTQMFSNAKTGIIRYLNAVKKIDAEFKPLKDELDVLQAQYKRLSDEINKGGTTGKYEQAESLKRNIERKADGATMAYQKRQKELTDPISNDIGIAMAAFAKRRGIDLLLDISNGSISVAFLNDSIDITQAFIADYNARNP